MRYLAAVLILAGCSVPHVSGSSFAPVDTARGMIGLNERTHRQELRAFLGVDPVRYEWCAAFVNATLNLHGIPGSESVSRYPLVARSFLQWGEKVYEPQRGDLVVFPRGNAGWQGHVGFYMATVEIRGIEHYIILGGNQDDSISYEYYPSHTAIGIRRFSESPSESSNIDYVLDGILLADAG